MQSGPARGEGATARDAGVVRGGPKTPLAATPARLPGSVRRTSTIDSARPDGWAGSVRVSARARDLHTRRDGTAVVLASTGFAALLSPERILREIDGSQPRLAALIGAPVAGGFRARALASLADEAAGGTLLNLLIDDLPGASLVAGYALQRNPAWPARAVAASDLGAMDDLCAGWATDATIFQVVRADGVIPVPTSAAIASEPGDDPDAWHERPPLPAGAMRRARRLDVVADGATDGTVGFAVHFRDSHQDAVDGEGAVHEYVLQGRFSPASRTIMALDGDAPVLPWTECPRALGSVKRVVGMSTDDLRARIRAELTGTSTCTHLNDVLRSLADLPVLAAALAGPVRS